MPVTWRRWRNTRDWSVLVLTVIASAIALGQWPSGHPVLPALSFSDAQPEATPPASAIPTSYATARTTRLGGATTAKLGSTYTLSGRTGTVNTARATGTVVLRGAWNGGRWNALATTSTDRQGRFSLVVRIRHRGSLRLRLSTPDGYVATGTLSVP